MPVTLFAMVMGMAGLTLAWEKASETWPISLMVCRVLLALPAALLVVLLLLYLYKAIRFRGALLQEWAHPAKFLPPKTDCTKTDRI